METNDFGVFRGQEALFIPGPTNIPTAVSNAMAGPAEDHRAVDMPDFALPLFEDTKQIFQSKEGRVIMFPSSGTGGWEAAMTNTLSPGDKVLIARFGQFTHLWADLCERHGLDVDIVDCEWGTGVPLDVFAEKLREDKSHTIKAVLVCHNETATGVTSDVKGVRDALDDANHPAFLFVDGISSIGSIPFYMDDWGVDIAIAGSQKGLMLPAGMAILCVSQKALNAYDQSGYRKSYFDFKSMMAMNDLGYFPYTPSVQMLRALRVAVDMLLEEGMENVYKRHNRLARGVRAAVDAWGLENCAKDKVWYSDTVTAICLPKTHDSVKLVQHARTKYRLALGAGLNKVAGKVFRIGHLGSCNEAMMMMALGTAEMVMLDMGVPITGGSGVAAAQKVYCEV